MYDWHWLNYQLTIDIPVKTWPVWCASSYTETKGAADAKYEDKAINGKIQTYYRVPCRQICADPSALLIAILRLSLLKTATN